MAILIIVLIFIPIFFMGYIVLKLAAMINRFYDDVEAIEILYDTLFGDEEKEEKYKTQPMPMSIGEWEPTFKNFSWAVDYLADYIKVTNELCDILEKYVDETKFKEYRKSLININAKVREWKWKNGEPESKLEEEENR